jgi:hypothetical protein
MQPPRRNAFYWRAFVTFYVIFSFLVIAASGIVLYVAPPGRVANWSQWTLGALQKSHWQAVHTVFAFLFVLASAFHVYFNWRVIIAYLKTKLGARIRRRRELALATALGITVLVLTLNGFAPFGTVMTVGETVKNSWSNPATEPPVPHAELWTVGKFAESTKVPVAQAMENLRKAGMAAEQADVTLQAVASMYGVTPQEVYAKALGDARPAAVPLAEGGGYGAMTVQQIADQLNLPVATALERLRQQGIAEAAPDSSIRALATAHGRRPFDLVQMIQATAAEQS